MNPLVSRLRFASILLATLSLASASSLVTPQTIDDEIGIGYGLEIADINGDGKDDILLVDKDNVAWYENPTWEKHVISGPLTEKDHVSIAARDTDGDGKAEIAVGAQWQPRDSENSGAVFLLKPGATSKGPWAPQQLHHEPTVHRMLWVKGPEQQFFLTVLPLHGRGNDAGTGAGVGLKFLGYNPPTEKRDTWDTFLINNQFHKAHNYDIVSRGEHRSEELLSASMEGVHLLNPQTTPWKSVQLSSEGAGEVRHGKLPNGKPFVATIEPIHGNEVVVNTYTSLNSKAKHLDRTVLADDYIQGHALAAADFLGIGSDQIIAGRRGSRPDDAVGIQLFQPNADGSEWTLVADIDSGNMACEDLKVGDLDGDGRPEIVACGRRTKNVVIYWNNTTNPN